MRNPVRKIVVEARLLEREEKVQIMRVIENAGSGNLAEVMKQFLDVPGPASCENNQMALCVEDEWFVGIHCVFVFSAPRNATVRNPSAAKGNRALRPDLAPDSARAFRPGRPLSR